MKAKEEGKNLERNLEELHGVWGAECQHSGYRNKRDLRWSVAHNYREPSYKPQGEMRGDAVGEVGGGHISVEGRDNITWPEERTSAFIVLSGEVSDGQLHQIALPAPPRYLWLQTPFLESTKARAECLIPASADAAQECRIDDQFADRVNHGHVDRREAANVLHVDAEIEAVPICRFDKGAQRCGVGGAVDQLKELLVLESDLRLSDAL